jgi:hypothetical protein
MSEIKTTATFDDKASPGVKKLKSEIDKLSGKGIKTNLDDKATPAIRKIKAELDKLKDTKINVGVNDRTGSNLRSLRTALAGLSGLGSQLGTATSSVADSMSQVTQVVGDQTSGMLGGLLGVFGAYKGILGVSEAMAASNARLADSMSRVKIASENLTAAREQSALLSQAYKEAKKASGIERAPAGSDLAKQRKAERDAAKDAFRPANAEYKAARAELVAINKEIDALAAGRALTVIGGAFTTIAASAAVAYAAIESVGFATRAAADDQAELADKLGITVDQLAALTVVANENGTSVEGLQSTFDKLSRSMNKFDDDNKKSVYAFESLGITMQDIAGLSEREVAGKIIENYELLGRSTKATAAAQQLLGSGFREQIPAIKAMGDSLQDAEKRVKDFGAAATEDVIKAGGEQETAITNLGLAWKGLANEIARSSGTIIQDTATFFADLLNSTRQAMAQMREWQQQAKGIKETVSPERRAEIAAEARRAQEEGRIGPKRSDLINYRLQLYKKEMEAIQGVTQAEVDNETARLANRSRAQQQSQVIARSNNAKPPAKDVKELKSELEGLVDQLNLANRAFGLDDTARQGLEAKKKYLDDIKNGISPATANALLNQANAAIALAQALRKAADEQKAYEDASKSIDEYQAETQLMAYEASLVGKTADKRERLMTTYREELALRNTIANLGETDVEEIARRTRAAQEARAQVRAALDDANLVNEITSQSYAAITNDVQRRMLAATKLLEDGKITVDDYLKYVEDQMGRFADNTEAQLTDVQSFWAEAAKGIQGDFQTFFFDVMQGNTTSFAQSMKRTIDGVIANILAAKAATALFGSSFDRGNVGGLVGSGASWLGALFSGARASGGPVSAGSAYLVGENGPEPFIPNTSGTILPNSSLKNLASNQSFNISVTAIDSKDLIAKMSTIEKEMARMVNNANSTYRVGAR